MATGEEREFGVLLRWHRQTAGLSQEALAERAGLSAQGISNLERGIRRRPYRHTILQLAAALELKPEDRSGFEEAARPIRPPEDPDTAPAATRDGDALIGRAAELEALERHLQGEGAPLLLLAGEPGIGKSRLLQEVTARGQEAGWVVLAGGCQRWSRQEPYAPLIEALDHFLTELDAAGREAVLARCGWLSLLLPALVPGESPPGQLAPEQERRLVFGAVKNLLINLTEQGNVLLVLDDLQWAGLDALELLGTLVRALDPRRVRVVGAYRDTEVGARSALHTLLADLAHTGLIVQKALGGLSEPESTALLKQLLGRDCPLEERIVRRAGGVPFFLLSCAHSIRLAGVDTRQPDAVPWDLAQSLRQRVSALSDNAQTMLGVAAVVGRAVPVSLLMEARDLPESELISALEEATGARLLEETEHDYCFAHDVIREVVEADLSAARRAMLHRKVAAALERQRGGAAAELIAYHYVRGDDPDKAVLFLEMAGDLAEHQYAHEAAETQYRELLKRLDRLHLVADGARVREKLGIVLARAGRYDAALEVFEQAAKAFHDSGDAEGLARAAAEIGTTHGRRGDLHKGASRMRTLLEGLEQGDPPAALAATYEVMSHFQRDLGEYREALAASTRAVELARSAGATSTAILSEWSRVDSLSGLGQIGIDEVYRSRWQALPEIEALGDLTLQSRAYHDLAYMDAVRGDVDRAECHVDRALATAKTLGDSGELSFAIAIRGWLAFLRGEWQRAGEDLETAAAISAELNPSWYGPYPRAWLANLRLAEGDRDAAAASANTAMTLARRNGDLQAVRWSARIMAELDLAGGRPEAAVTRLVPLLDRPGQDEYDVTALLVPLGWARLELGQVDQATETVELAITRARRDNARLVVIDGLRVQALIALHLRRWDAAERSLKEGLSLARATPYRFAEEGLLRVESRFHAARDVATPTTTTSNVVPHRHRGKERHSSA